MCVAHPLLSVLVQAQAVDLKFHQICIDVVTNTPDIFERDFCRSACVQLMSLHGNFL